MVFLNLTKTKLSSMSLELWKKQLRKLNIAMSKAKENMITIRHGRIRRMKILIMKKGFKPSNFRNQQKQPSQAASKLVGVTGEKPKDPQ